MPDAADVATLVRRAQDGERSAFDALVRAHFVPVYSFLHRLVGNPEDAEDLAQETFVRAHGALARYRSESSFSTWLLRIAHHLAIDHRRRQGRAREAASFDEQAIAPAAAHGTAALAPADALQRGELVRELARALARLPDRLRAVLVLRVLEGRDYDEIGAIVGVRPATARTQVMQARRLLLRWLAPGAEDAP
jgi:RNA polymerase sigma-70 factor, ECF subfamily